MSSSEPTAKPSSQPSLVPPEGEYLVNGWEPDLPAEDTLVRQAVLAHASWPLTVARAIQHPWRSTSRWAGALVAERGALSNPVLLLQPLTDAGGVLDEVGSLFPRRVPYLLLSAWPTPDLVAYGLDLVGHPPLMVRFPDGGRDPSRVDEGVEVREVRDADDLARAERVLVEGYPMPDLEPLSAGDLLGLPILDRDSQVWLGWVDGLPAAVAAAHHAAGVTLVEHVAVLPAARGRGVGAAVTWAATRSDPAVPAVLLASDDGRPVYERMGYVAIERWTAWLRPGAPK
jgi:GNAT superfamily N-acetyltransferase